MCGQGRVGAAPLNSGHHAQAAAFYMCLHTKPLGTAARTCMRPGLLMPRCFLLLVSVLSGAGPSDAMHRVRSGRVPYFAKIGQHSLTACPPVTAVPAAVRHT